MTIPNGSGIEWVVLKKVALEIFKGQLSIVVYFVKFGVAQEAVFFEFPTDQSQGKRSSIDRDICLLEQEWNPTDVVLVSVCDQNSLDAVDVVYDVRVVRNDIVDTQQVIFWEFNPSIDDDNLVLVFNSVCVFPDFSQTTDGKNADFFRFKSIRPY